MLLIRNATHLDAPVDLLVNDGKIVTMMPAGHYEATSDCDLIDAAGLLLLPALIDCHAHLREPGQEYKEDIATGLEAAAHGGFGAVMCMANTKPVNDNASVTELMQSIARKTHPLGPALYPIAAATINLEGKELSPLAEMAKAGCVAVSNDGKPLASTEITRRVMEYAYDVNLPFIDHCEDPTLAASWVMNEGKTSGEMGVKGQPTIGETIQVLRDIMLSEYLKIPVHIAHVSCKLSVEAIAWAKSRGVQVTAETCPHYLLLDETALEDYNPLAKVSPPLRTQEDRKALLFAIKNGIIDILATDHAPHAASEKNVTLDLAPFGFTGLDLALGLTFRLVEQNELTEADIHRLWSKRPGEIFNLPHNEFAPNDPADFILYDPNIAWKVDPENLFSKSANTPFLGQNIQGRVKHLWLKGKKIF